MYLTDPGGEGYTAQLEAQRDKYAANACVHYFTVNK